MRKGTFLTGAALGYLLGTRAGRARYEQIVAAARRFWENPKVQETVGEVEEKAAETAKTRGHELSEKVGTAARGLVSTAQEKVAAVRERGKEEEATPAVTPYEPSPTGGVASTYETTELTGPQAPQAGSNGRLG